MNGPPVALTVAGSDNSAGAGLQADLKVFSRFGVYGLTAATCVVAEVPGKVSMIQPVRRAVVAEQIRLCLEAFPVRAVKTGMLYSADIIEATVSALARRRGEFQLVVDPVMVASSGDPLLKPSAIKRYFDLLFPLADLVTPNTDELALLARTDVDSFADMSAAGKALAAKMGCAFLLKGGHLRGKEAVDVLARPDGTTLEFRAPYIKDRDPHGTGCTYSAAITAGLAAGKPLEEAIGAAKSYITEAIRGQLRWPRAAALDHRAGEEGVGQKN